MAKPMIDYQSLQAELDEILSQLQSGELGIDAALPAYERGLQLVKQLETHLEMAQNKVVALQAKLQD